MEQRSAARIDAGPQTDPVKLSELALELARVFVQRRPFAALTCALGCGLLLDSLSSPGERRLNRKRLSAALRSAAAEHPEIAQALEQAEALLNPEPSKSAFGQDGVAEDGDTDER